MKILALFIYPMLLCGCTINVYDKAASRIEKVYFESICCGHTVGWHRSDAKPGHPQDYNYSPDLQMCVNELKEFNNGANVPYTTAVVEIVICMRKRGWEAEIADIVITT